MKLKATLKYAKTSTESIWHHETLKAEVDYFHDAYVKPGKITVNRTFSDGGLIMTLEHIYDSVESRNQFMEDTILSRVRKEKELYNAENSIFLIYINLENYTD